MYSDGLLLKWLVLVLLITTTSSQQGNQQHNHNINPELIEAALKCSSENNKFALNLYNILRQKNEGNNLLISPLSLRTIMAMLQGGSRGSTAKEIQIGMNFPQNNTEHFRSYTAMRNIGDYTVKQNDNNKHSMTYPIIIEEANRIYIKKNYQNFIKNSFELILKHQFQTILTKIDFTNNKKAAEEINNWVSEQTQQKINNLIQSDSLNNQTRMILVNTLYFKGPWENRFHGRSTQKHEFYISKIKHTNVDMMNIEAHFSVVNIEYLNSKAIALPYEGKRFQLVILLPNNRFGLNEMESKLNNQIYSQIFENLKKTKLKFVDLSIPKFSIESSFDLIETMQALKMNDLFNEKKANFKGIADTDENLYVNKLVQKTFLTVEEQGSEAGAATFAAVFTPLSIGPTLEENIVIDHPFMGFIYDTKMNLILFSFRKTSF